MRTEKPSVTTENSMHTAEQVQAEISALLRLLASPVTAGESVKACVRRASVRAGLPYGQVKRMWYREWREIPAHVADIIRERARQHDKKLKAAMFQSIVAMQDSDPAFYRECTQELGDLLFQDGDKSRQDSGKA